MLIKGVQHSRGHGALAQLGCGDIVNFLHRGLDIDAQDVDLISIPQDLAEPLRAFIQTVRQAEGTVPLHRRAQQAVGVGVIEIVPDAPLVKQDRDAQRSMADRLRIHKGVVPAQLLKAAHIVQYAAQPCKVDVLLRQRKTFGDPAAEGCHAVGVVDLELYLRVSGVVMRSIVGKGPLRTGTVDFHSITPRPYCSITVPVCKLRI